jgi:SAM-dependent methyltransferase
MKKKTNYELLKIREVFSGEEKGRVLDLGCGGGGYSRMLKDSGFSVTSCDLNSDDFPYKDEIEFKELDFSQALAFGDAVFDYVLCLEVIEHLEAPFSFIREINRILKPGGILIISTPNILNLSSRLRYLTEGAFDYFRQAPLDQLRNPQENRLNLHIFPHRYHDLEYILGANGFRVTRIFTSVYEHSILLIFLPLIRLQLFLKDLRAKRRGLQAGHSRMNKILLSKELLFGRHLIIRAQKLNHAKGPGS